VYSVLVIIEKKPMAMKEKEHIHVQEARGDFIS
jgi:hypothetical protein